MDYEKLISMRNTIENLDDIHHPEILRILKENSINYTENRNGCFANLTLLDKKTIKIIENYISFIKQQKENLDNTEQIKKVYKSRYFEKDTKDKTCSSFNVISS